MIDVMSREQVISCDERLAGLLSDARIEFETGSAVIGLESGSLLNSVAQAASTCPGTLRIEGHTDNVGSARSNNDLSLRRAEAVRQALIRRGLPPERLISEGRGAGTPIADNTSAAGRARNRRIEIRVVRIAP